MGEDIEVAGDVDIAFWPLDTDIGPAVASRLLHGLVGNGRERPRVLLLGRQARLKALARRAVLVDGELGRPTGDGVLAARRRVGGGGRRRVEVKGHHAGPADIQPQTHQGPIPGNPRAAAEVGGAGHELSVRVGHPVAEIAGARQLDQSAGAGSRDVHLARVIGHVGVVGVRRLRVALNVDIDVVVAHTVERRRLDVDADAVLQCAQRAGGVPSHLGVDAHLNGVALRASSVVPSAQQPDCQQGGDRHDRYEHSENDPLRHFRLSLLRQRHSNAPLMRPVKSHRNISHNTGPVPSLYGRKSSSRISSLAESDRPWGAGLLGAGGLGRDVGLVGVACSPKRR